MAKTITTVGGAQVDTAQSVFGGASCFLDGDGDYLTTPDHADFTFGSADFTIEARMRIAAELVIAPGILGHGSRSGGHTNTGWVWCYIPTLDILEFYYSTDGGTGTAVALQVTWNPSLDTWYHMAVVRNGNNLYFFVDGTQVGSTQDMTGVTIFNSTFDLWVGAYPVNAGTPNLGGYHDGWFDEIRISDTARWTSGFTPAAAAYTWDSNTKLLIHADGSDASTSFTDDDTAPATAGGKFLSVF